MRLCRIRKLVVALLSLINDHHHPWWWKFCAFWILTFGLFEDFLWFQFRIYLKLGVGGFHISGAFSRSHQFRRETKPQPNAPQYSTCTCYKEPRQPNGLWQTSNGVQSFDCSGVQSLNSNVVQSFECNCTIVQHCNIVQFSERKKCTKTAQVQFAGHLSVVLKSTLAFYSWR